MVLRYLAIYNKFFPIYFLSHLLLAILYINISNSVIHVSVFFLRYALIKIGKILKKNFRENIISLKSRFIFFKMFKTCHSILNMLNSVELIYYMLSSKSTTLFSLFVKCQDMSNVDGYERKHQTILLNQK